MHINVRGVRPEHTIDNMEIDVSAGVEELRRAIAQRVHATPEQLRLIYRGRLLDGSQPLESILQENATIHTVVSVPQAAPAAGSGTANNNNNNNSSAGSNTWSDFAGGIQAQVMHVLGNGSVNDVLNGAIPMLSQVGPMLAGRGGFVQFTTDGGLPGFPSQMPPLPFLPQNFFPNLPSGPEVRSGAAGSGESAPPRPQTQQQQSQPQQQPPGQPQTQRPTPPAGRVIYASAPPLGPGVAVNIHLHVTLNELDEVPERLAQLRRSLSAPEWHTGNTFPAHTGPPTNPQAATQTPQRSSSGGGEAQRTQDSQGEPMGQSSENREATSNTNNNNSNAAPAAAGAAAAVPPQGGPSSDAPGAPQNITMSELSNQLFGPNDEDGDENAGGLVHLSSLIFSDVQPAALFQLQMGNWSTITRARLRLREAVAQWVEEVREENGSTPATPQDGVRLCALREAANLMAALRANENAMRVIEQERRSEQLFEELDRYFFVIHRDVFTIILDESSDDAQWTHELRRVCVRSVGIAVDRAPLWFTREVVSFVTTLVVVMRAVTQQYSRDEGSSMIQQALSMLPILMPNFLRAWHTEYIQQHRQDSDATLFQRDDSSSSSSEDLLSECLNEFCADEGVEASATNDASNGDEISRALHAWAEAENVSAPVEEEMYRRAQRFRFEDAGDAEQTGEGSSLWKRISGKDGGS